MDLYRLRRAHLEVQEAELWAELARQRLRGVTLALERRYGILGRRASIDVHTGAITLTPSREGSDRDNSDGYSDPGAS